MSVDSPAPTAARVPAAVSSRIGARAACEALVREGVTTDFHLDEAQNVYPMMLPGKGLSDMLEERE